MAENENIHKGHRQRMMKKFLEYGIDCFAEHEVLEILLYSCYSRRNTNDIAHGLIRRFGSLKGVLNAGVDELCEVDNVGPNAAAMLRFFKAFALQHAHEDFSGIVLDCSDKVCEFCYNMIHDCKVEVVHALFMDDAFSLLGEVQLSRGVTHRVAFDIKKVVAKAIETHSTKVILAHNHPHGVTAPTSADVSSTRRAYNTLINLGIELTDHIIVNDSEAYSMRSQGHLPDIWF